LSNNLLIGDAVVDDWERVLLWPIGHNHGLAVVVVVVVVVAEWVLSFFVVTRSPSFLGI
jgi:hypothetical protein